MGWLMGPIYSAISWILLRWHELFAVILPDGRFLGSNWDWVLAIMFLVITVRVILFPIFVKQIRSQRAMQALQPKLKELQVKHKGDQQTLREEMMKLYQTEKVNPLMGCLPMFLQIPVFLGLFHVLKGLNPANPITRTLYGWTGGDWDKAVVARLFNAPLAAHFSSTPTELSSLHASGVTVKIVSGVLVLIMMATTFATSRQMILKTGWSQDPQQRMIQKLMLYGIPFSLLISGWYFPIGVIIYWVTQNAFSFCQQYYVLHKYPPPVTAGSTPMKAAKTGAPASKGILARLLPGPDAGDKAPVKAGRTGFLSQPQPAKSGLFRRKVEAPAAAVSEPRALAPRPGAKPVHPKVAAPSAAPTDAVSAGPDGPSDAVAVGRTVNGEPVDAVSATGANGANGSGSGGAANGGSRARKTNGAAANGTAANGRTAPNGAAKRTPAVAARGGATPARKATPAAANGSANGSTNGSTNGVAKGSTGGSPAGTSATAAPAPTGATKSTATKSTGAKKPTPRKGPAKKGGARR